ncbi:MAG: TetR/AcrR family transcriptional regulator [Massilia sp.]
MARPRQFDTEAALQSALLVFWNKGYEGASLTDLADAMAIGRPSLHAAFGTKEELYRKALQRYVSNTFGFAKQALAAPTAADVAKNYLVGYCARLTRPEDPSGCLLIKGVTAHGEGAAIARKEVADGQTAFEAALTQRFYRAQQEGDLAADADAPTLAACLTTIARGLAVRADSGASFEELHQIALALGSPLVQQALPSKVGESA